MRRIIGVVVAALTLSVFAPTGAGATELTDVQTALIRQHAANKHITFAQAKVELDRFFAPRVVPADGSGAARAALLRNGASRYAADRLVQICMRESHCRLHAHNYSRRTRDDSFGPWQINYYGNLRGARTAALGSGWYITSSWDAAARAVLRMSNNGRNLCPWIRRCYS
jgi:hypothetical protein